eukprot:COSAG02_NODE_16254_length_1099_cov_1.086000_2_plen_122_part_00
MHTERSRVVDEQHCAQCIDRYGKTERLQHTAGEEVILILARLLKALDKTGSICARTDRKQVLLHHKIPLKRVSIRGRLLLTLSRNVRILLHVVVDNVCSVESSTTKHETSTGSSQYDICIE